MLRYPRGNLILDSGCINFRFEKERYTPYTKLSGRWFCPKTAQLGEIVSIGFYIDGTLLHLGYPTATEFLVEKGQTVLKVSSRGYSAMLAQNQCADGLITDVDLAGIIKNSSLAVPNVTYQQGTPTVNYVNYYEGTSLWDSIVSYSIRAANAYPYISGANTVTVTPPSEKTSYMTTASELISRSNITDYSDILSAIYEKDVDGTPDAFSAVNTTAAQRSIVRRREINFDREWIMDSDAGLRFRINCSMRKMNADKFSFFGYHSLDLIDRFALTDLRFTGEVDRLVLDGTPERGIVTTVWCYHDQFCN